MSVLGVYLSGCEYPPPHPLDIPISWTYPPPGHTHPLDIYPPLDIPGHTHPSPDIPTTCTYPPPGHTHPLMPTSEKRPGTRHAHPLPQKGPGPGIHTPLNSQTDTNENITFPQLRCQAVTTQKLENEMQI